MGKVILEFFLRLGIPGKYFAYTTRRKIFNGFRKNTPMPTYV